MALDVVLPTACGMHKGAHRTRLVQHIVNHVLRRPNPIKSESERRDPIASPASMASFTAVRSVAGLPAWKLQAVLADEFSGTIAVSSPICQAPKFLPMSQLMSMHFSFVVCAPLQA